jgi:hypothetical protein
MFDGAKERAVFLDEYLARKKKTIGPSQFFALDN